jgi:hypothetical protein
MTRIFSSLAVLSTCLLIVTFGLGWNIGDASMRDPVVQNRVSVHFLTAVGALCFAIAVHALVLTYFMGTGRWLEETCTAYRLGNDWQVRSRNLKWGLYPAMMLGIVLLIVTGAFGGAADPASAFGFRGFGPFTAAQIHLFVAAGTLLVNMIVNGLEFVALQRNGTLVHDVLQRVRQIRIEKGLEV